MKSTKILMLLIVVSVIELVTAVFGFGQDKIRIGVPLFPTVAFPAFVAKDKGFFEKNGLQAEIIRINSEPTTYQALISGSIDVAAGAPAGLVLANIQGVPVVSLGSWDNTVPYTLATREKIADLSKLKGKKIGVNRLGGKSSLILRVMLEDAGLNPAKDVILLQLGGSQERLAALMRGGVDAAPVDYAFEPKMKQMGFFLVAGRKTSFMNGSLAVKQASLRADPGKWKRFVKAFSEATQYIKVQKEGTLEVLSRVTQMHDRATLDFIYEEMRSRANVSLRPPQEAIDNLIKMVAYDDKRALSLDKSKLFDISILNEPEAAKGNK
jgi:ABC-type nitrate/sulfonate/bicarbonate transport system substrate-binding protein